MSRSCDEIRHFVHGFRPRSNLTHFLSDLSVTELKIFKNLRTNVVGIMQNLEKIIGTFARMTHFPLPHAPGPSHPALKDVVQIACLNQSPHSTPGPANFKTRRLKRFGMKRSRSTSNLQNISDLQDHNHWLAEQHKLDTLKRDWNLSELGDLGPPLLKRQHRITKLPNSKELKGNEESEESEEGEDVHGDSDEGSNSSICSCLRLR